MNAREIKAKMVRALAKEVENRLDELGDYEIELFIENHYPADELIQSVTDEMLEIIFDDICESNVADEIEF